jgi:hypothetical protein
MVVSLSHTPPSPSQLHGFDGLSFGQPLAALFRSASRMVLDHETGLYQNPSTNPNKTPKLSHGDVSRGYTRL